MTDPAENLDSLPDRLRMRYAAGPMINGEPEFGWRDFSGPAPEGCMLPTPLMLEAATEIERLRAREKMLLDSHTGCGCDPGCKVCAEKGYT